MADFRFETAVQLIPLCNSSELEERSTGVPFDVEYCGQTCRGFAIRYDGRAHAYLNRCAHVPMEMDYQPNKFFDDTGDWLICSTHGAIYYPASGHCAGGPCRGNLIPVELTEKDGVIFWHTSHILFPVVF